MHGRDSDVGRGNSGNYQHAGVDESANVERSWPITKSIRNISTGPTGFENISKPVLGLRRLGTLEEEGAGARTPEKH